MVHTKVLVKLVMGDLLRTMKQIKRGKKWHTMETGEECKGRVSGIQTGLCWPAQKGGREPTPDSKLSPWSTAVRSQTMVWSW